MLQHNQQPRLIRLSQTHAEEINFQPEMDTDKNRIFVGPYDPSDASVAFTDVDFPSVFSVVRLRISIFMRITAGMFRAARLVLRTIFPRRPAAGLRMCRAFHGGFAARLLVGFLSGHNHFSISYSRSMSPRWRCCSSKGTSS